VKVLVFTNLYPSQVEPTLGIYNKSTFEALARYAEVRVVAPIRAWARWKQPGLILNPVREREGGVESVFPPYWSIPTAWSLHAAGMYLSMRPWIRELRRDFPFDVIIGAWAYPDAVAASLLAREANVPLVTAVLGSDVNEFPDLFGLRPQIRYGFQRAQRVLAVSRAIADRVVELGAPRERVLVQHNGVDGARFRIRDRAEARKSVGIEHDRPVIGYVGNIRPVKGSDVLIEAMDHLVKQLGNTEAELWIVGSGEIEAQVRARTTALGLDSRVRFLGRQPHEAIPRWMSAVDVFCLPSRNEGCPNVILEALASGKPVVASRVGGIPELLTDGENGYLVPAEDPAALAGALAKALGRTWDPEALRATVTFLSWDAVALTYQKLLGEVLEEWRREGRR
jgi:glycosyltransferase involved in cell wall biosynthesis